MADINGTSGNDVLVGTAGNDTILGGGGDDDLSDDLGGSDVLRGDAGNDILRLTRSSSAAINIITMVGGTGNDIFSIALGNASSVSVRGDDGDDILLVLANRGQIGAYLGEGHDVVRFDALSDVAGTVTISDFVPSRDKVEWVDFLETWLIGWDQIANPFTTGHLRMVQSGSGTNIVADRDGAGGAEAPFTLLRFDNLLPQSLTAANLDGMVPLTPAAFTTTATSILHEFVTDAVFNGDRTRMYIARSDGTVTTYDTLTGQVLGHLQVGGQLGGLDISADGSFLLVVDKIATASSSVPFQNYTFVIHKVDLATGLITDFTKVFFSIEGPFNDVALFADGTAIATTTLRGSGATSTYRLDTQTGVFTLLASPSPQAGIVVPTADRLHIYHSNGFNVSGQNRLYDLAAEGVVQLAASRSVGSSGVGLQAVSADGSFIAYVEHQTVVEIFDGRLNKLGSLAGIAGNDVAGLAFDDHGDYLYVLLFGSRQILKITTSDWSIVAQIAVPSGIGLPLFSGSSRFGAAFLVGPDNQYFTYVGGDDFYRIENPTAVVPVQGSGAGETMNGTAAQDILYGLGGDDNLNGGDGNDTLRGGAGNDVLDGGAGHDAMYGGDGDDIYYADDARDRAAEADAGGGSDEVRASASFELEGNIERLILTGAAAIDGIGNAIANAITGNDAANILDGMGGNDLLVGNGGNDILRGGTGIDDMRGGLGDDAYHVDRQDDLPLEIAGEGTDTAIATVNYTLGANIENLTLAEGAGALSGTGNALANVITGNSSNNVLDGGAGADTLIGGSGSDTYIIDLEDQIVEAAGAGSDLVLVGFSYALTIGLSVERLSTNSETATTAIDLTGNELTNVITGNAGANILTGNEGNDVLDARAGDDRLIGGVGNDRLTGGGGRDLLEGGAGTDTFVFATILDSTGSALRSDGVKRAPDLIADFETGIDKIDLSAIDAIGATGANDAFTFIGSTAFTGQAGELRCDLIGGAMHIYGDVDGNGIADFEIVAMTPILEATDFVL